MHGDPQAALRYIPLLFPSSSIMTCPKEPGTQDENMWNCITRAHRGYYVVPQLLREVRSRVAEIFGVCTAVSYDSHYP